MSKTLFKEIDNFGFTTKRIFRHETNLVLQRLYHACYDLKHRQIAEGHRLCDGRLTVVKYRVITQSTALFMIPSLFI